jgi:hypothetical protein
MTTLMNERLGAVSHTANVLTADTLVEIASAKRRGDAMAVDDKGVRQRVALSGD